MMSVTRRIAAAAVALFLAACAPIPDRLVLIQRFAGPTVALNLDAEGAPEVFHLDRRTAPSDSTALVLTTWRGEAVDQMNLPGLPVTLRAIPDPLDPVLLVFTKDHEGLHAFRIGIRVDQGRRLDSLAHGIAFPAPAPPEEWDVAVGDLMRLPAGELAFLPMTGHALAPRGLITLDPITLERRRTLLTGPKLQNMVVGPDGYMVIGSHAAENGAYVDQRSDSSAWMVSLSPDFKQKWYELGTRIAGVDVQPETDSTAMVHYSNSLSGESAVYRYHWSDDRLDELKEWGDSVVAMRPGQLVGSPDIDWAMTTRSGGVYVRDGETGDLTGRRFLFSQRASLSVLPDLDGDGLQDLSIASEEHSGIFRSDLTPLSRRTGWLHVLEHVSQNAYLANLPDGPALAMTVEDADAIRTRQALLAGIGLMVFLLLVSNTVIWFALRRISHRPHDQELFEFLVSRNPSGASALGHIVRIREALLERAHDPDLSVPQLAEAAGYGSARELNGAVRSVVGHTARDLIEQHRLHHARDLLVRSGKTIEEIARSVGFNSHQYFTTRFKKAFGVTPSEYRQRRAA